jgi:hypothetical protein
MTWKFLLPAAAVALSACATIVDEKTTNAVIQSGFNAGERYTIRQRTMEGPQGTYQQTSVVYKGISATCRIDSPNDCARAAETLVNNYSFGGISDNF